MPDTTMICTQAMLSLFLLAPCDEGGGGEMAIADAVAIESRPAEDVARDATRRPDAVLGFLGLKPGMTVLEVFSGGGYYTQILDTLVGPDGRVISHNNDAYMGYIGDEYETRFHDGGLPNTERVVAELDDLALGPDTLDAALLILTWHDFLYADPDSGWMAIDERAFVDKLCAAMKPGAVLGVVDHVANPNDDPAHVGEDIHRVDPAFVKAQLSGSCFDLEAESDLLANPKDDHTTNAWNGPFRGRTDRFLLKYRRR